MRARVNSWLRAEHRRNPWMLPGIALTGSAALGTHLSALIELARTLWS